LNIIKIQFGPWLNQIGPLKFNYVIGLNSYTNSSNNHLIWPLNLHFSIFGPNSVHLGLEIPPKIAAWFPPILQPFLVGFLRIASLYFIFLIFILKKSDFWGITQNWVMTGSMFPFASDFVYVYIWLASFLACFILIYYILTFDKKKNFRRQTKHQVAYLR